MKKVVLKLKEKVPVKVRSNGMHLGMCIIEMRPRVFEYDEKEFKKGGLLKSKQFDHYMEVVEVRDLDKLKIGAYTDGKKVKKSVNQERADKNKALVLANKEKEVKKALDEVEKMEVELNKKATSLGELESELKKNL